MAIESSLAGAPGVRQVSASVFSRTVLIVYDGDGALQVHQLVERVRTVVGTPATWPSVTPRPARGIDALFFRGRSPHPFGRGAEKAEDAEDSSPAWHTLMRDRVAALLETDRRTGLEEAVASERLQASGLNTIPPPARPSILRMVADQLSSLPVLLLCGSAVLSAATGGIADAVIILLVVAGNASAGVIMELQAERSLSHIVELAEPPVQVVREGVVREISAERLVPGDLIVLARETRVPADGRLVAAADLTVDESMLTGESVPVEKGAIESLSDRAPLADRWNMVFRGTVVTGGSGFALVTATGIRTEVGRLQALAIGSDRPETALELQLGQLGTQLVFAALGVSAAVFFVGLVRGLPGVELLRTAVSLALAAIPEGLPAVATTALASSVSTLHAGGIVVRRLRAMEALGTVDVVCLDKTGTLTANEMSVVEVVTGQQAHALRGNRFSNLGGDVNSPPPDLCAVLQFAALCTSESDHGTRSSSTESALLRAAAAAGLDVATLKGEYPLQHMRQRAEGRNMMMTVHSPPGAPPLIAIKGNPLEVLELCDRRLVGGSAQPIGSARQAIVDDNDRLAKEGQRVLGVAVAEAGDDLEEIRSAIWLGLIGMMDPLREAAIVLVNDLKGAGVIPVMLTGDQSATAAAIAEQLGLNGHSALNVVDGTEVSDTDTLPAPGESHVYARVSPRDKLRIVRSYQREGQVVAMTGDGVNDSPALKAADIGIALGQSGTRIARDVADVLLLDDDVRGITSAIAEGRRVHANIRKAVHYIIASNLSELLVMLGGVALGPGQPLNARQLLWINLLTDVLPELALALEPRDDTIRSVPLDARAPVVSRSDYARLVRQSAGIALPVLAAYGAIGATRGAAQSSGVAFAGLTAAQLLHAFGQRSHRDGGHAGRSRLGSAVAAGFGVMSSGMLVPALRRLLGIGPVSGAGLLVALSAAGVSALINGIAGQRSGKTSVTLRPLAGPVAVHQPEVGGSDGSLRR